MMHPLNLCRQLKSHIQDVLSDPRFESAWSDPVLYRIRAELLLASIDASEKFLLPVGGSLMSDPQLRGIIDTEKLSLPFDHVALEFLNPPTTTLNDGALLSTKSIIFLYQDDTHIKGAGAQWLNDQRVWNLGGWWQMARSTSELEQDSGGVLYWVHGLRSEYEKMHNISLPERREIQPDADVMLDFLNILGCSNVGTEAIGARQKSAKHCKNAQPFDSYRVLTVGGEASHATGSGGGSHRSPREHVRRGHIVRPQGRRPFWRNATVVNAGIGGRVDKDYRMTA